VGAWVDRHEYSEAESTSMVDEFEALRFGLNKPIFKGVRERLTHTFAFPPC